MKALFNLTNSIAFLLISISCFSQTPAKWSINGNAIGTGEYFGTTNNQPILFFTNSTEQMRLKPTGELRITSLSGSGNSFVVANNFGDLNRIAFPNDSTVVLTGAGTFSSISSYNIWQQNGNSVFLPSGNVGIGISTPQYKLDVNGNAHFNGTVYANGITLLNKMEADTIKGTDMMEVNNNLELAGGAINEIYTKTGDLRLQSHTGYNGNLFLAAGTTGNVGVGTLSPQYKFDVNGEMRVTGSIRTQRIQALPGDTLLVFGDSTIYMSTGSNKIYHSTNSVTYKGMSIGTSSSSGHGLNSVAIGTGVWTTSNAINSLVLGSGSSAASLRNDIANCLMVGFNSNIPTFFVGTSTGINTLGRVGIRTTNPLSDFQLNEGIKRVNIASGAPNAYGVLGYMGFNAEINSTTSYMHTTGDGTTNTGGIISLASDGSLRFNVLPNVAGGNDVLQDPLHFASGAQMRIYDSHIEIGQGTISTLSPYFNDVQTKLMVGGRVMCQDVIVSLVDWQDEVFDSTYQLMPMDSVNAFIRINGHLPGVPTESKIETDGMSVAETAQIQQAKIEEMMLYILQLNERMKALEAENAKLKAEGGK